MKIKALMKRKIEGIKISSMTSDKYKIIFETVLKDRSNNIKKVYSDPVNEAGKFYVR